MISLTNEMCTLHMVLLFWITNPHAPLLPNSHKPFPVYSSRTAWPSSQSNTCSFLPLSKGHSRSFKYCYYTNMLTTRKWQHTTTLHTLIAKGGVLRTALTVYRMVLKLTWRQTDFTSILQYVLSCCKLFLRWSNVQNCYLSTTCTMEWHLHQTILLFSLSTPRALFWCR